MDSITIQYIILAVVVFFAGFSIFKIIKKNFAPKKFNSKGTNCDQDCGCS